MGVNLYTWARNGKKRTDITDLATEIKWSGETSSCCRECRFGIAAGEGIKAVPCELMDTVDLYVNGKLLFRGQIWSRTKASSGNVIDITAFDAGFRLKKNVGVYKFKKKTAKQIAEKVAGDFDVKIGILADPPTKITRNFLGISLYKIIQTAYTLAAEKSGKQYQIVFEGDYLDVRERGARDATYAILPGVNMTSATITESAENMVNRVKVYDENNKYVTKYDDTDLVKEFGVLQNVVKQAAGDNKKREAQQILKEGRLAQKITVQALGDTRCRTGDALYVKEPVTGIRGQFFIDEDEHIWKNGQYFNKMVLNFQNLMDEMEAGGEEAGYATPKKTAQPVPSFPSMTVVNPTERDKTIAAVLNYASTKIGCGYSQKRRNDANFFDCSSFVRRVWYHCGVSLKHYKTGEQVGLARTEFYAKNFEPVKPNTRDEIRQLRVATGWPYYLKRNEIMAGDLIFYKHNGYVGHVAMAFGPAGAAATRIIHARNPENGVCYDDLGYMWNSIVGVLRYMGQ